jgi:DNA polymerase III epsilon subunit-like protein
MIFLYANYYFNFDFNVTCITGKLTTTNISHKSLLKAPSHKWEQLRNARQSINDLRSYDWEQAVGLGVVLGYNRLRALDIDGCEDFTLINEFLERLNFPSNYKWLIQSGSKKGFHILFYSDNHKFNVLKNKVKAFKSNLNFKMKFKHIELRWIGHLVLPPSLHPSKMHYQFLNGIPLEAPSEIALENLYGLLKKYCSGKSLKEVEETKQLKYVSGVYIEEDNEDEEIEEVIDVSGRYIEEEDEFEETKEVKYVSGVYIEEEERDEETEKVTYVSGVYIEEDDEEEEIEEVTDVSGVYIDNYKEPYYLFFDTETTGVPNDWNAPLSEFSNWPRLVQLAYLLYDAEGQIILSNEMVIKPSGFLIPKNASDVHGITTDYALKNGQEINDVLSNFEAQCLRAKFLVAHNINFDSKVIGSEFLRNINRNPISKHKLLCTMEASTDFCKIQGYYGYKWPKLSELHIKLFGEDFDGAHDALADIEATARCFWEMRKLKLI